MQDFVDIKYATYKTFEQSGKISFENYLKILIKLNKDDQFLKFLNSFEFDEQKQRTSKKTDEKYLQNDLIKPIIEVSQKQIVLDKKIFGEELFYSVENGYIYESNKFKTRYLESVKQIAYFQETLQRAKDSKDEKATLFQKSNRNSIHIFTNF